ncbi:MAG: DUF167 domain-containing protein [Candidatus Gastranaerophilales bacterium]|nr:DUF167 domain-containing protein [Candidatus Gastranaerophilales bacterium]
MDNSFNILQETKEGIIFCARLVPNSSFNKIAGYTNEYVRIKISAPAVENKANKEFISFCSELFDVNKSKISIVSGEKSKVKKVLIKNAAIEDITQKLMFVLDSIHKD